jgi:uncharacterized Fe-S radical SAM superfamily protein PflX
LPVLGPFLHSNRTHYFWQSLHLYAERPMYLVVSSTIVLAIRPCFDSVFCNNWQLVRIHNCCDTRIFFRASEDVRQDL